jgi:uncharacterized membrane protein
MRSRFTTLKSSVQLIASNPTKFFTLTTLVFGVVFLLLIPPFQIPDEFTHFTRAYEVSELKTAHVYHGKTIDHLGSFMPKSILLTYKKTSLHLIQGQPDVAQAKKYHPSETKQALHIPLNKSVTAFYDTGSSPSYFPLLYLPQAVTIKILSLFNSPVIVMLYATRFVGLLIWLALALLALRVLRPSRRAAALVGVLLLPMFVAQASTSTDPLINGLALLFVALISRNFIDKVALTRTRAGLYMLMLALMSLSKPVYAMFGLLLFLLPGRSRSKDSLLLKLAILVAPLLIVVLWSAGTKTPGGPYFIDSIAISHASPSLQAHHVIPNVFNFVEPLVNTLFLGWGDNVFVSMMGEFGKLDTPLPLLFVILGYIVLFVALCTGLGEKDEPALTRNFYLKRRTILLTLLTAAFFAGGVYLAMYIYSTPPGEKIITGVQGRYFLPLLPLGVLFIPKSSITIGRKLYYSVLTAGPLLVLVASVLVIYLRFYPLYP